MGSESLKHRFAKEALATWLREVSAGDCAELYPLSWRVNRGGPHFGVWTEYPVCIDAANRLHGISPVWDEWDYDEQGNSTFGDAPPSYDECIRRELLPLVIFDIAIQHKGLITHAIEVVYKNDISPEKQAMLDDRVSARGGPTVWKIDAEWVLRQPRRPGYLPLAHVSGYRGVNSLEEAIKDCCRVETCLGRWPNSVFGFATKVCQFYKSLYDKDIRHDVCMHVVQEMLAKGELRVQRASRHDRQLVVN